MWPSHGGPEGSSLKFNHWLAPSCVSVATVLTCSSYLQVGLLGKEAVGSPGLREQRQELTVLRYNGAQGGCGHGTPPPWPGKVFPWFPPC